MSAPVLRPAAKEARALAPMWLATAIAASVTSLDEATSFHLSRFAFIAGMASLGALAVGHEYGYRTLDAVLTLPIDRRRLYAIKLSVLAAMLLPLALFTARTGLFPTLPWAPWGIAIGALCLAPPLTMLCRSALAGAVFALALPGALWTGVTLAAAGTLDLDGELRAATLSIWQRLLPGLFAAGAVAGWVQFMRLQSLYGGRTWAPSWFAPERGATPSHPLWQLLKKELRLQQMAFIVAALSALPFAAEAALGVLRADARVSAWAAPVGVIAWLGIPVLIGAVAIAEERRLSTHAWQQLLPVPAWQQWAIKAATVLGLALLLAVALPVLIVSVATLDARTQAAAPHTVPMIVLAVGLAAVSLYVSSLNRSGVRAIVWSAVVISVLFTAGAIVMRARASLLFNAPAGLARESIAVALIALLFALLFWFAFVNQRAEDRPPSRIVGQAIWAAGLAAAVILI